MVIKRAALLAVLKQAVCGLASKEVLEQSNAFVFTKGKLVTFNDEVMARCPSPFDFEAVVDANDLQGVVSKFPDDELDITKAESELVVRGHRRTAGIACSADVLLPLDAVPEPGRYRPLGEGVAVALQQASRVCGRDDAQYLTTCVHITPDVVEACDNFRYLRVASPTGIKGRALVPAGALAAIDGISVVQACVGEGWVHFKGEGGVDLSLRCGHEEYHKDVERLLDVGKAAETVKLPEELAGMITRAELFNVGDVDARMQVDIQNGTLTLTSRKDGGWFRERHKVKYAGMPLAFEINPRLLTDILARTRKVRVGRQRMLATFDQSQFVVVLYAVGKDEEKGE